MKNTDWHAILDDIDWLVIDATILTEINDEEIQIQKLRIHIIDGSTLEFYEAVHHRKKKYKYGFQWFDKSGNFLHRWDNTPHHQEVATFPFHQHIGIESNVQPSEPMTLAKVLAFIAQNLS